LNTRRHKNPVTTVDIAIGKNEKIFAATLCFFVKKKRASAVPIAHEPNDEKNPTKSVFVHDGIKFFRFMIHEKFSSENPPPFPLKALKKIARSGSINPSDKTSMKIAKKIFSEIGTSEILFVSG
jgi:hypothetical protein